jgi:hypothetical protein
MHSKVARLNRWLKRNGFLKEAADCIDLFKSARLVLPTAELPAGEDIPATGLLKEGERYVYVLKLQNLDDQGRQIMDPSDNSPIYNWYVGMADHPIRRYMQHSVGRLYLSKAAYEELLHIGPKALMDRLAKQDNTSRLVQRNPIATNQYSLMELLDYGGGDSLGRCGARWTNKHKPLELVWLQRVSQNNNEKPNDHIERVGKLENQVYYKLRDHYGEPRVVGGPSCRTDIASRSDGHKPYENKNHFDFNAMITELIAGHWAQPPVDSRSKTEAEARVPLQNPGITDADLADSINAGVEHEPFELWPHWKNNSKGRKHLETIKEMLEEDPELGLTEDAILEAYANYEEEFEIALEAPSYEDLSEWGDQYQSGFFEEDADLEEVSLRSIKPERPAPDDLFGKHDEHEDEESDEQI